MYLMSLSILNDLSKDGFTIFIKIRQVWSFVEINMILNANYHSSTSSINSMMAYDFIATQSIQITDLWSLSFSSKSINILSERKREALCDSPKISAMADIKSFSSAMKLYGNRHERHVEQYQLFISRSIFVCNQVIKRYISSDNHLNIAARDFLWMTLEFLKTNIPPIHICAHVEDIYNQDIDTTRYMILWCTMNNHWWIRLKALLHNTPMPLGYDLSLI